MERDLQIVIDPCEGEGVVSRVEQESCGEELYGSHDIRYIADIDKHTAGRTADGTTRTRGDS